jgi:8-amino-7-oxononanoate synthase
MQRRPELRERLWENAEALYEGLSAAGFEICSAMSPIIAIRLPDEQSAVWTWNRLLDYGVYVNLALPPGTPNAACLLRCSVSAAHSRVQIDEVCARFARVAAELAAASPPQTVRAAHA